MAAYCNYLITKSSYASHHHCLLPSTIPALLTTFQSVKVKKSKDSYKANLFVLNRNFILLQGKMYIFVIKASNKRIYTFYGDDISTDGILIISRNDKSIINWFSGKPISDFRANS